MNRVPANIMDLFSPEDIVDMSVSVDDCRCQCREHITVQDGLLNVHGRPIFDRLLIKGDLLLPGNQEIRRLPDLLAVTGTVKAVGMAGLTMGGGYGPFIGNHGLALDNLLGAEVVPVDFATSSPSIVIGPCR